MTAPFSLPMSRINDISVQLTVELGSTRMPLREVLALSEESVILLEKLVDEPVELLANGTPVARGEVVADRNRFGIRIIELIGDGDSADALPAPEEPRVPGAQF
ncbi:flagellar motor switch protein FliN [Qipengyuania sp.]|uniref:flagellar motor switch protein FliN n=1 Tax=Qipengyuania sp. TaxID=2004515 RepID=UPI0035C856E6